MRVAGGSSVIVTPAAKGAVMVFILLSSQALSRVLSGS